MLTLGHIIYSNCFPPHAGIVTGKITFPFKLVEGIPTELNRLLEQGTIHVSPSSSIEYALNQQRYRPVPRPLHNLPRGSQKHHTAEPRADPGAGPEKGRPDHGFGDFRRTAESAAENPLRHRTKLYEVPAGQRRPWGKHDAALFIGDLALKTTATREYPYLYDLGRLWNEFTGLPFVFALWQINHKKNIDKDLPRLYDILMDSKSYGISHIGELATAQAGRFGLPVQLLIDYWTSFSYELGEEEQKGLMAFYGYAAEIGAIDRVPELHFWNRL